MAVALWSRPSNTPSVSIAVFKVVDQTTGEPINVNVSFGHSVGSSGAGPAVIAELTPDGCNRVSWVGPQRDGRFLKISADGYESRAFPEELVKSTTGTLAIGGELEVQTIQIKQKP